MPTVKLAKYPWVQKNECLKQLLIELFQFPFSGTAALSKIDPHEIAGICHAYRLA